MMKKSFLLLALAMLAAVPFASAQDAPNIEKVCLVTDVGRVNDGTFNQYAYDGMVQAAEDFMDDLVAFSLERRYLLAALGQVGVSSPHSFHEQRSGLGDVGYLIEEEGKKLFFAWKKSHRLSDEPNTRSQFIFSSGA